jgi:uncharacterized MAPEG superfamily protein
LNLTPELTSLAIIAATTALMWAPYAAARFVSRGILAAMGNPGPGDPPAAPWAERAKRAHMNALENLVLFAPVVLIAALAGISTPTTVLAAKVYVLARLGHYAVYVAGIPVVRTVMFMIGLGATLVIAAAILGGA